MESAIRLFRNGWTLATNYTGKRTDSSCNEAKANVFCNVRSEGSIKRQHTAPTVPGCHLAILSCSVFVTATASATKLAGLSAHSAYRPPPRVRLTVTNFFKSVGLSVRDCWSGCSTYSAQHQATMASRRSGNADDAGSSKAGRNYQVYRGMSPTTSNRLEVCMFRRIQNYHQNLETFLREHKCRILGENIVCV